MGEQLRDARRLPASALPALVELLAVGTEPEVHPALMALLANGAKVNSDGTDDRAPTWFGVTLPDGTVVTRQVPKD